MKINFIDFWPGFVKDNNYFFHLLSKYNCVIDEDNPDIIFCSVYSNEINRYRNHRCKKIFYTGENIRPPKEGFDLTLSFDIDNQQKNHHRLPLWVLYLDWFNKKSNVNPDFLLPMEQIKSNEFINKPKTKFCAAVFSNPKKMRFAAVERLSQYKKVDGYGSPFKNKSKGILNKYQILSKYKFSICFENSISPKKGYYTEKLLHAKTAGTIPIYWSDEFCSKDFNAKAFLNLNDYFDDNNFSTGLCIKKLNNALSRLIEDVVDIDNNNEKYESILNQPLFKNGEIPEFAHPDNILDKIMCCVA